MCISQTFWPKFTFFTTLLSFLRGDQYAIALALLDEGKVVLGVLACPNLSLGSIGNLNGGSSGDQVGALFSATIGCGAEVESLQGSPAQKVTSPFISYYNFDLLLPIWEWN